MSATVTRFPTRRYTTVAITLHWVIAICILTLLASGWWMTSAIDQPASKAFAYRVYQLHKAVGLTVLVLSLARLAWRLGHKPPPLSPSMGRLQRMAAEGTHIVFYVLMIAMPLLGWAMVSASPLGLPTSYFGLFTWPHLPGLAASAEGTLKTLHGAGGFVFAALAALHIAAALKHQFVDRDDILMRMLPAPASAAGVAALPKGRPAHLNGHANGDGRPKPSAAPKRPGQRAKSGSAYSGMPAWLVPVGALLAIAAAMTVIYPPVQRPKPQSNTATPASRADQRADEWRIVKRDSRIAFAGTHAGSPFKGTFDAWDATITFDPANLAAARVAVTVDLASANTGDSTQTGTLQEPGWLDSAKAATARFETQTIRSTGPQSYVAEGTLAIRGVRLPVILPFTLVIDGGTARMSGQTELKRLDFGIGRDADASGSWVSLAIPVTITVVATRGR